MRAEANRKLNSWHICKASGLRLSGFSLSLPLLLSFSLYPSPSPSLWLRSHSILNIRFCRQKLLMHTWLRSELWTDESNKAKNLFIVYSTKKWIFQSMFKICIISEPTRTLNINGHSLDSNSFGANNKAIEGIKSSPNQRLANRRNANTLESSAGPSEPLMNRIIGYIFDFSKFCHFSRPLWHSLSHSANNRWKINCILRTLRSTIELWEKIIDQILHKSVHSLGRLGTTLGSLFIFGKLFDE